MNNFLITLEMTNGLVFSYGFYADPDSSPETLTCVGVQAVRDSVGNFHISDSRVKSCVVERLKRKVSK